MKNAATFKVSTSRETELLFVRESPACNRFSFATDEERHFFMMSSENRGPAYQGLAPTLWFKHVAVINCKVQISIALHLTEGRSSMIPIVFLCLKWALLTANPLQTQTLSCQQQIIVDFHNVPKAWHFINPIILESPRWKLLMDWPVISNNK